MSLFYGRTYLYPTTKGAKAIGVTDGLGHVQIVAWVSDSGGKHRIRSRELPAGLPAAELQMRLDAWAAKRRLPEVRS